MKPVLDYFQLLQLGHIIKISDPKGYYTSSLFFIDTYTEEVFSYNPDMGLCSRNDLTLEEVKNHFDTMLNEGMKLEKLSFHDVLFNTTSN